MPGHRAIAVAVIGVASIAPGCGGDSTEDGSTQARPADTTPTVGKRSTPDQARTTPKSAKPAKPSGGGKKTADPAPTHGCPPGFSARRCQELARALKRGGQRAEAPDKPRCPQSLTKEQCEELAEAVRNPPPDQPSEPICPPPFTTEQCQELAAASRKASGE